MLRHGLRVSELCSIKLSDFLWHFPCGRCVITSGSWTQLTEQLFMDLREFSTKPLFRGWSFLDSEIRTPQGGFAVGLRVDDPQRIEGWYQSRVRR
jgi:hypothetical protein